MYLDKIFRFFFCRSVVRGGFVKFIVISLTVSGISSIMRSWRFCLTFLIQTDLKEVDP